MDLETHKKDLEANQVRFNNKINKRNELNLEIIRLEAIIGYQIASIKIEEEELLAAKQPEKIEEKTEE